MSFEKLFYKGKEVIPSDINTITTVYVTKVVRSGGFAISGKYTEDGKDYRPPTMEELCKGHKWRHRSSKHYKNPLPKNWIYCYKCGTEMLEALKKK